jgi:hypothetical protein
LEERACLPIERKFKRFIWTRSIVNRPQSTLISAPGCGGDQLARRLSALGLIGVAKGYKFYFIQLRESHILVKGFVPLYAKATLIPKCMTFHSCYAITAIENMS